MKPSRLFLLVLLGAWLFGGYASRAQVADPTFYPAEIYAPAPVEDVLVLRSGSRLVLSASSRLAEGMPCSGLVRYTPAGQPDVAFNTAVGTFEWVPTAVAEDGAGRLLVASSTDARLGGQSYGGLVRLLPDGTPDASFAQQPPIRATVAGLLVQPDGKIVVAGTFRTFGGQTVGGLVRLNADGTLDQPFLAALGTGLAGSTFGTKLALQADGKLLLGGAFTSVAGQPRRALARLNVDGSLDASFAPTVLSTAQVGALVVQPDGKLVVGTVNGTRLATGGAFVVRLTSTGAVDASFAAPVAQSVFATYGHNHSMVLLSNGSLLFAVGNGTLGQTRIVRLTSSGALDNTWNTVPYGEYAYFTALAPLPNGQVLAAGAPVRMASLTSVPVGVSLLNADGTYNPSFVPQLRAVGNVQDVALQPDGKMIIIGDFTDVNGLTAQNLARLNADGSPDPTFNNLPLQGGTNGSIERSVLLLPNGKMLISGDFTYFGTTPLTGIARLNADGSLDTSFSPPFRPNSANRNSTHVSEMALQPDGNVVVSGILYFPNNTTQFLVRLLGSTGQLDTSFQPVSSSSTQNLLVQPDGRILLSVNDGTALLRRLLPSGAVDPTFTPLTSTDQYAYLYGVERYPDGRLLVCGSFEHLNGMPAAALARLLPNGTLDASFVSGLNGAVDLVHTVAIQPNQRVVFASEYSGIRRVMADGTLDQPFNVDVASAYQVNHVKVQPDGGLLFVGSFENIAGSPRIGVARVLDPYVLPVRPGAARAAALQAWPVPAHAQLHLRLEAAARPQRVQLLDALGRPVRTLAHPAADATLDVRGLPVGAYLLRVEYADGPVTRRVVVE